MITKGKATTGRGLAAHLLKAENERVELWDISGTVARTVNAAVDNWRAFALGTTCDKPLYHAQLNPSPDDRPLSREEWEKAIGLFEKEMGLEGYPRAVVFHEKKGREHIHLVYSRFNPELEQEKLKAWSDSWNYPRHERASREIERALGLQKTKGVFVEREGPRPERTPTHDAMQQGERTRRDPKEIKAEVSALYASAANGPAFVEALEAAGYTLARGDKRGFVILDPAGGVHSLTRAASAKAGDLGKVLQAYRLDDLPSVEEARETSKTRQQSRPAPAIEEAKAEITEPAKTALAQAGTVAARVVDALDRGATNAVLAVGAVVERAAEDLFSPDTPQERRAKILMDKMKAARLIVERTEQEKQEARAAKALEERRAMLDEHIKRRLKELEEEERKHDQTKEQDNSRGRERSRF